MTLSSDPLTGDSIDPDFVRVAARLKRLREERGQTLDELAGASSLSKAYLSRLESAERQPSLAALFALAHAWDVPVGSLLDEDRSISVEPVHRRATVEWHGNADGHGLVRVGSGMIEGPYTRATRTAGEGINPEELIGAAEAACFTMSLAGLLTDAGYSPESLTTDVDVHGQDGVDGFRITRIDLKAEGRVPGLSESQYRDYAFRAKRTCTVSRVLTGVEIAVEARLAV